jgi:hypothetical protein
VVEDLLLSPQQALQESPHQIDQAVGCDGDDYPCQGWRLLLAECAVSRTFAGTPAPEVLVKQVVE